MLVSKGFVVNRAGRVVVPSNVFPSLDVRPFETLDQLQAVIRRDFDSKAISEATTAALASRPRPAPALPPQRRSRAGPWRCGAASP